MNVWKAMRSSPFTVVQKDVGDNVNPRILVWLIKAEGLVWLIKAALATKKIKNKQWQIKQKDFQEGNLKKTKAGQKWRTAYQLISWFS